MALVMILYATARWLIESVRGDEPAILAGMTLSQVISVGLFLLGVYFWFRPRSGVAGRHADAALPASRLDGSSKGEASPALVLPRTAGAAQGGS